jgi:hypothetical protein
MVYRDVTRQAKGLYRLKHVGALGSGLTYLNWYNSGWFCHTVAWQSVHVTSVKIFLVKSRLIWYEHGESQEHEAYNLVDSFAENEDRMDAMMDDFVEQVENSTEVPKYFGLLVSSKEPLNGVTTLSQLAAVTRLMAIKLKYNFSVSCYNDIVDLILDMLPKLHKFPKDFYHSKKLLAGLGMLYQKIHVCKNNCMLF